LFIIIATALFQIIGGILPWFALKKFKRHTNKIILVEVIIMFLISLELAYVGISITKLALLGVVLGIMAIFLANKFVPHKHGSKIERLGYLVFIAMCLHELPEGMAFGSSYIINKNVGLITAFLVAIHNIPEGSIIAFPLLLKGKLKAAMKLVIATQVIYVIGGLAVYILLISFSDVVQTMLMSFAAGAMMFIAAEELMFIRR